MATVILNFRIEQEFGLTSPIDVQHAANIFSQTIIYIENMLDVKKTWFQKGYSRKQALQHKFFIDSTISSEVLSKWEKRYKKNHPFFGEGIWDGESDDVSIGIDLTSSASSTKRRNEPMSLVVEFPINLTSKNVTTDRMLKFMQNLLSLSEICTFLNVESGGYSFSEITPRANGYDEVYKKVFPDRVACGWMIYIPSIILSHLIPEASRVVPVVKHGKQIGTIVVSTEDVFDGNNKEHIAKSNDIEIRLLDLGLLPLMTEL